MKRKYDNKQIRFKCSNCGRTVLTFDENARTCYNCGGKLERVRIAKNGLLEWLRSEGVDI